MGIKLEDKEIGNKRKFEVETEPHEIPEVTEDDTGEPQRKRRRVDEEMDDDETNTNNLDPNKNKDGNQVFTFPDIAEDANKGDQSRTNNNEVPPPLHPAQYLVHPHPMQPYGHPPHPQYMHPQYIPHPHYQYNMNMN